MNKKRADGPLVIGSTARLVDHYALSHEVGRGAYARVYAAVQRGEPNDEVAIKILIFSKVSRALICVTKSTRDPGSLT